MNKLSRFLFCGGSAYLLAALAPGIVAADQLIDCGVGDTGGDNYTRGIYIPDYPGSSLERVTLYLMGNTAGEHQVRLDVLADTYEGAVIGSATVHAMLETSAVATTPVTFNFGEIPINPGASVPFRLNLLAGPGDPPHVTFSVSPTSGCPVVETGATGDGLGYWRRAGVNIQVEGDPAELPGSPLHAAILPSSRSVQEDVTATAFASLANAGLNDLTNCRVVQRIGADSLVTYRTTDPATNMVVGGENEPVDVMAGGIQTFLIQLQPYSGEAGPLDLGFWFDCDGVVSAPVIPGLNTLLYSKSTMPAPDVIAMSATTTNDGIVVVDAVSSTGVFSVATVNLGAAADITVSTETDALAAGAVRVCETDSATSACLQPAAGTVSTSMGTDAAHTFGVFVSTEDSIAFDPAQNRIRVLFRDATDVVRGSTSVAVRSGGS